MPRKLPDPHPCSCSPDCTSLTRRTFAQGHDMKRGPFQDGRLVGEAIARGAFAGGPLLKIPPRTKLPVGLDERQRFLSGVASGLKAGARAIELHLCETTEQAS